MKEKEILYLVTNKVLIMIDTKQNSDKMEEPIAIMIIKVNYLGGNVKENTSDTYHNDGIRNFVPNNFHEIFNNFFIYLSF